jgi:UPF0716 family protein affecting phage T7 exclusion
MLVNSVLTARAGYLQDIPSLIFAGLLLALAATLTYSFGQRRRNAMLAASPSYAISNKVLMVVAAVAFLASGTAIVPMLVSLQ